MVRFSVDTLDLSSTHWPNRCLVFFPASVCSQARSVSSTATAGSKRSSKTHIKEQSLLLDGTMKVLHSSQAEKTVS
jgi:hypothetical protein